MNFLGISDQHIFFFLFIVFDCFAAIIYLFDLSRKSLLFTDVYGRGKANVEGVWAAYYPYWIYKVDIYLSRNSCISK